MNGIISGLIVFVGMVGIQTGAPEDIPPTQPVEETCPTEEVLWLARVAFSETKVIEEMPYIAWVVRNRVETGYMGDTYKEVALYPSQFSGLNIGDRQYHTNISLTPVDTNEKWQAALTVAHDVCHAPESDRLFPKTVRHFYSPISVVRTPAWADDMTLYYSIESPTHHLDRFAFYDTAR